MPVETIDTRATNGGSALAREYGSGVDIQNLGPGKLYVSASPDCTPGGPGIEVAVGEVYYTFDRQIFHLTADQDGTDVRVEGN